MSSQSVSAARVTAACMRHRRMRRHRMRRHRMRRLRRRNHTPRRNHPAGALNLYLNDVELPPTSFPEYQTEADTSVVSLCQGNFCM